MPSLGEKRSSQLLASCRELLDKRYLIVASNRGPVEYHITPEGRLQARRGSGGVVTALESLIRNHQFTWVSSAMGEGDRKAEEEAHGAHIASPLANQQLHVRFVVTPRRVYHKYYNILCNPLLWFLQHQMWSPAYTPNIDAVVLDAWETGYVSVNQTFANSILTEAQEASKEPLIMLHDYHLYLVGDMLRQHLPKALIHHFVHIPWPAPAQWQLLPKSISTAIFQGLCGCDILGFQSLNDVLSFLQGCHLLIPGSRVDYSTGTVELNGHRTLVRSYPLSIDVEEVVQIAVSPRAQEYEKRLQPLCAEHTIVRIDRAEPSKNVVRGFKAYESLLQRHPELHGKVKFLAFLVPSRTHIKQYERYLQEIEEVINSINSSYGKEGWQPITPFFENNYTQAIAGMRLYDVLLVNPVVDGMNLVAKEGPVVNIKNGVVILSETAGAYEQLQAGALAVNSADLEGTMQAMYRAITMDNQERESRAKNLIEAVAQNDINVWLMNQIEDLEGLI